MEAAPAAEDRDAAEQHGGDHLELEAGGVVAAGAAEAKRVVDAGERRDRAGEHEEPELRQRDVDAGEVRGLLVEPDLEDAAAEGREVQQPGEADQQEHERDQDHRQAGAVAIRSVARSDQFSREVGDGLGAEQPDREAAEEREGADGDRERGQADVGDQETVQRPGGHRPSRQQRGERDRSPAWCSTPTSTLVSPTTLATERSISPVTMTRVIGRAISRIGAVSSRR